MSTTIERTTITTTTTATTTSPPKRYIFVESDMHKFRKSPIKQEFLQFINALGRSCINNKYNIYEPHNPLKGLSPSFASLHGSLNAISKHWLKEIPPDQKAKARFGNPSFRLWHDRLIYRSHGIVNCMLKCHEEYSSSSGNIPIDVLEKCSKKGYACAISEESITSREENNNNAIVTELCAYLHSSFGHAVRLDYGTGHESSFLVFLFSLFKIKCLDDGNSSNDNYKESQCIRFSATATSIISQYLEITRGLQLHYMLEPAGSHGVWGLDDYHCLPLFFGACQLINNPEGYTPESIHDNILLKQERERYLYFGCIQYIKQLKHGVPFFESSPMLNDISALPTWNKLSQGLIRLYEGEVLDKLQVVQHFEFGDIFKATWIPSEERVLSHSKDGLLFHQVGVSTANSGMRSATTGSSNKYINNVSSSTNSTSKPSIVPTTRAPWAK